MRWVYVAGLVVALATTARVASASTTTVGDAPEVALPPLTLEDVLASVQAHHPSIEAGQQAIDKAAADVLAAEGGFDLVLKSKAGALLGNYPSTRVDAWFEQPTSLWGASLYGGYRLGLGSFATYDGKWETRDLGELRAGVEVPLWKDGPIDRRRADLRRAELYRTRADHAFGVKRLELLLQASIRYWDWVAAGQSLKIARTMLEIAELRNIQLTERARRGDVPELERTDNLRSVYDRQAKVVMAERKLESAAIKLSLYLRNPNGEPVIVSPLRLPIALPSPDDVSVEAASVLQDIARVRRPEISVLQTERAQVNVDLQYAHNQLAPGVDVVMGVAQDLGAGSESLGKTDFEAGVRFDLPILLRNARGKLAGAEANGRKLDAETRYVIDQVAAQVNDALSALAAAKERVSLAVQQVEAAALVEASERRRFSLGDTSILQVNLREQATADARLAEIDARLAHAQALAQLRAATGELL